MAQLHEILAVERDKEHQAKIIMGETTHLWGKPNAFSATKKRLEMFDEKRQQEAEAMSEDTAMATTVPARLAYTADFLVDHLDVLMQKEATNQAARGDIVLDDGTVVAKDIPATMLLNLERELAKYRAMFAGIPTLDASEEWEEDPQIGEDVYKTVHPVKARKTEKSFEVISLAKATREHKEQVKTLDKDVVVGQYVTKKWSGMVTSARKATIMKRVDQLLAAVKTARMRANTTEVVKKNIGNDILGFILK